MKKLFCSLSVSLGLLSYAQDWKTDDQYIQNFAQYAVEEMELYKVPASITLAQGILETGGGQSRLAKEGKNHFGIKCKENWTGKTMTHTDDAPNECFRVYDTPRDSYRDHSLFLTTRKHYSNLFKLDIKNYKGWAHGLKKAGYATNPQYAYILINRIEKYKLYEFDNLKSNEVAAKLEEMYPTYKSPANQTNTNNSTKTNTGTTNTTVNQQNTSVSQNQTKSNSDLEARIEKLETRLSTMESSINARMDAKVTNIENNLAKKIDSKIETKLESELETRLESKIESKLESKIESKLNSKLKTKQIITNPVETDSISTVTK